MTDEPKSFSTHLEALRQTLFRVIGVVAVVACVVFCFKDETFNIILAPTHNDFIFYRQFNIPEFHVKLIATELSSQFMTHLTISVYMGLLLASPIVLWELFRFVSPGLYEHERKAGKWGIIVVYLLFIAGLLMTYFILFPVSFRFLGTYSVAEGVENHITLDNYVSTFLGLMVAMGLVFQLPVVAWLAARFGIVTATTMRKYRRHALIGIMLVAGIITPPDVMSLFVVTLPLYLLYEASIFVAATSGRKQNKLQSV